MYELLDRGNEQWALLYRGDLANEGLAIFVHGFQGNYLSTWGKIPNLIKLEAHNDPVFSSWDYLFLGYDTGNIDTYLDIALLINTEWNKAEIGQSPFLHPYTRLALFGHSLGTLGIRQLLCAKSLHSNKLNTALSNITLFGSPLSGSPLAPFAKWSRIASALSSKSPQLRMLKEWVESTYMISPWPKPKVILGLRDKVVGHIPNQWVGDEQAQLTNFDHSNLVKPTDLTSPIMGYIKSGLAFFCLLTNKHIH